MSFNKDDLYRLVGAQIRRARTGLMSQETLAKQLGLSRVSVVNIEAGKQKAPLHVLWRIAEALNTDIGVFIPSQAELDDVSNSAALPEAVIKQIEAAAAGNPETKRQLEEALQRVGAKSNG